MEYLLDTNICIYLIKKSFPILTQKLEEIPPPALHISILTVAELEFGIHKSVNPLKTSITTKEFLKAFAIINLNPGIPAIYGQIKANLEKKGTPIGQLDALIAAHAMSLDLTLITNNEREFSRIEGLKLENWTK